MTKKGQKKFVRELSKNIADSIVKQINDGKIPDRWDGHELRILLANRHQASASMSKHSQNPRSKAAREFKNTVLVNNL